jgi:hypothetical protein
MKCLPKHKILIQLMPQAVHIPVVMGVQNPFLGYTVQVKFTK